LDSIQCAKGNQQQIRIHPVHNATPTKDSQQIPVYNAAPTKGSQQIRTHPVHNAASTKGGQQISTYLVHNASPTKGSQQIRTHPVHNATPTKGSQQIPVYNASPTKGSQPSELILSTMPLQLRAASRSELILSTNKGQPADKNLSGPRPFCLHCHFNWGPCTRKHVQMFDFSGLVSSTCTINSVMKILLAIW